MTKDGKNGFVYPLYRDKEIVGVLREKETELFSIKIRGIENETKWLNVRRSELIKIRGILG